MKMWPAAMTIADVAWLASTLVMLLAVAWAIRD
jgi:hypothetical protein